MGRRPSRPWTLRCDQLLNAWRYPRSARSVEPCERRYCWMNQQNVRLASSESAWNLCLMVAHLFDVREPFTGVLDHMGMTVGCIPGQPMMGPVFFDPQPYSCGSNQFSSFWRWTNPGQSQVPHNGLRRPAATGTGHARHGLGTCGASRERGASKARPWRSGALTGCHTWLKKTGSGSLEWKDRLSKKMVL